MDHSSRVATWLLLLMAGCAVWTMTWVAGSSDTQAHAVELAAAEVEAGPTPLGDRHIAGPPKQTERKAPDKAYALLQTLQERNGDALPGYVGGKTFQNRERRLPHGRYREYDVNRRVRGRPRDAERLVIEQDTGKAYYTNDHYRTFLPLN